MTKEEEIKRLLISILETISEAAEDTFKSESNSNTLLLLKYIPLFKFSKEDINLIKSLDTNNKYILSLLNLIETPKEKFKLNKEKILRNFKESIIKLNID